MRKYIVPTKEKIQQWMSYFSVAGQEKERQQDLMQSLLMMSMSFAYDKNSKQNEFFELYENSLVMAEDLAERGLIYRDDEEEVGQFAYSFCVSLVSYLTEMDILGRTPTGMQFECFVSMNMVINVFSAGDPYVNETEERACLSG